MRFPILLKNKLKKVKYYLGLFLKEEEGIILVLYENGGKLIAKEKERFHYSNGWEHIQEDIDEVLFRVEEKLNTSLVNTIFFIYSHFIDEKTGDIKKPYIQKVKDIVRSLELKALGYIECSEAILHYLEKREEMPLTAILIELDKTNIGVFVYKGGRIAYRKVSSRTNNLVDDLLTAFDVQKGKFLLPARIILYNSKDLDDESAKILTYHWSEDYFIQLPRVEVLKEDETIEGLLQVFQEQLTKEEGKVEIQVTEKEEVLGFVLGEDIIEKEKKILQNPEIPKKTPFFLGINFDELKKRIRLSKVKLPKFNISKRLGIILGILFIVLSLALNEIFLHKATLTVYLPADSLSQEMLITTSMLVSTSSASFMDSKSTTGKRDIGEHAKGSVTLYNFDDNEKQFVSGTSLKTNGLLFTLDSDVKVASSSLSSDGSAKLPGKNNGMVTAVDIGPESNIDKGQRFVIDNLSPTVNFAINETAFTGGTRKQVQTVATKDIEDLKKSISEKAQNQPIPNNPESINGSEQVDRVVIPQLSNIKLRGLTFSKEVGEEADSLTLQATVDTINFYVLKDSFLGKIVENLLPELKNGYNLEKDKVQYTIESVEKSDSNVTLKLSVKAKAMMDVSKEDLLKNVVGKNKNTVEILLKKQYQAEGFKLSIQDPLPVINLFLPLIKNNISIVISSL